MPIKISRSGLPIVRQALAQNAVCPDAAVGTKQACNPLPGIHLYSDPDDSNLDVRKMKFRSIGENGVGGAPTRLSIRANNVPRDITINSIVVSGISPSQPGQTYGGLHNFPRFVEDYNNKIMLDYAGSFLQLSFSNYATAPFEVEGWEYEKNGTTLTPPISKKDESLPYYNSPKRSWGYDVALQLAAAGPAASRFVVPRSSRNEFYSEPQINDPYIQTLCQAAKTASIKGAAKLNCTN